MRRGRTVRGRPLPRSLPSTAGRGTDHVLGDVGERRQARPEQRKIDRDVEVGTTGPDGVGHCRRRRFGDDDDPLGRGVAGEQVQRCQGGNARRPASDRSRPPTPRQWLTPSPAASNRHISCWAPVPDAATSPTGPGRTTLAKPSPTPPRTTAVPQSGPMTSRPRSRRRLLEGDLVTDRHVVAEQHDVQARRRAPRMRRLRRTDQAWRSRQAWRPPPLRERSEAGDRRMPARRRRSGAGREGVVQGREWQRRAPPHRRPRPRPACRSPRHPPAPRSPCRPVGRG